MRDIDQGGYGPLCTKPYAQPGQFGHNRFAHSLGVYLLLNKFGASIEEQIAGLLHDVSHSAFSHCIDYVLKTGDGKKHNHQDNSHDNFVKKTNFPKILKKYKIDLKFILNDRNFPLKEKSLPDLCADRIDYSLREGVIFKEITGVQAQNLLENLIAENGQWVFKDLKNAEKYAKLFLKLNKIYYSGFRSAVMFGTVGDCLKYALQKKYISKTDLYATDKIVLAKIKKFLKKDKRLNLFWQRMNDKIGISQNRCDYDTKIFCKSRIVDPLFKDNGKIKRLSEAKRGWQKIIKQELKPKEYFLKYDC